MKIKKKYQKSQYTHSDYQDYSKEPCQDIEDIGIFPPEISQCSDKCVDLWYTMRTQGVAI